MKKAIVVMVIAVLCIMQIGHTACDECTQSPTRLYYSEPHDLSFYTDPIQKNKIHVWGKLLGCVATFDRNPVDQTFDLSTLVLNIRGTRAQHQLRLDIEAACRTWAEIHVLSPTTQH